MVQNPISNTTENQTKFVAAALSLVYIKGRPAGDKGKEVEIKDEAGHLQQL